MVKFESGARGTFEASRTIVGPESQCAFEVYGTKGSLKWNLETMNELQLQPRRQSGPRLHHGLRRRPIPVPRQLCARGRQLHWVRGPQGN